MNKVVIADEKQMVLLTNRCGGCEKMCLNGLCAAGNQGFEMLKVCVFALVDITERIEMECNER